MGESPEVKKPCYIQYCPKIASVDALTLFLPSYTFQKVSYKKEVKFTFLKWILLYIQGVGASI